MQIIKNNKHEFIFDGAFGTYYYQICNSNLSSNPKLNSNLNSNSNSNSNSNFIPTCELANLDDKETVYKIHREYIAAGVDAIKTNTYSVNSNLTDNEQTIRALITNGYEIAMSAAKGLSVTNISSKCGGIAGGNSGGIAGGNCGVSTGSGTDTDVDSDVDSVGVNNGRQVQVFADIGYIHSDSENDSDDAKVKVSEEYLKLARIFIELGAKNFLFETLAEFEPLIPTLKMIKDEVTDATVIVSFAVSQDGYTNKGIYYKNILVTANDTGLVDVVGLNCTCGPSHLYKLFKEIEILKLDDSKLSVSKFGISNIKLCAMPNAGYPANFNGRIFYHDNVDYFSKKLWDIFELGVNFLGGCCGTTPAHIKALVEVINSRASEQHLQDGKKITYKKMKQSRNVFKEKIFSGSKVIAVELDPPINTDSDYLISAAIQAYTAGADIITIADSPLARTRADSILMAAKIKREVGIDVLPHLTCRDRNHIGIKAALLGANIENISNILAVTGDPISNADRGDYKGVFSLNSFNLISFINSLNEDVFVKSPFFVGGAFNINASHIELEIKRAQKKIDMGAGFFLTQPVFSQHSIDSLITARKQLSAKMLAGILPLASYKNALFLNNEVPGINVPESVIEMFKDKSPERSENISYDFSVSLIEKLWGVSDGFYLITPLKKINLICRIIKQIRETELNRR